MLVRMAKARTPAILSAGKTAEQLEACHVAGGHAGWPQRLLCIYHVLWPCCSWDNYLMKLLFTQRLYLSVHSSCIRNSQNWKKPKYPSVGD